MCISKPPKKRKFLANSGAAAVKSNFVGKAVEKKHVLLVFQKSFSFFLFLKKIHIPLVSNSYKVSQKFLVYKLNLYYRIFNNNQNQKYI